MFTSKEEGIKSYPDASLGLNDEEGKSTSGYATFMFGDLICWRTKKQNHVALSSAEAEYIAVTLCCRELIAIKEMAKRLLRLNTTPIVYEDNKATIELTQTDESKTLNHIVKICYHYARELVMKKEIKIERIYSNTKIKFYMNYKKSVKTKERITVMKRHYIGYRWAKERRSDRDGNRGGDDQKV